MILDSVVYSVVLLILNTTIYTTVFLKKGIEKGDGFMPSSKDRQRIEIPVHFYEQLA